MKKLPLDSLFLRKRASQCRALANNLKDKIKRLSSVAQLYEKLASTLEKRSIGKSLNLAQGLRRRRRGL